MLRRFCPPFWIALCLLTFLHCGTKKTVETGAMGLDVIRLNASEYPVFRDLFDKPSMLHAIDQQLTWLEAQDPQMVWQFGPDHYSRDHLVATLRTFRGLWQKYAEHPRELQEAIAQRFLVYQVTFDRSPDMLITSYHAPIYKGSLVRDGTYRFPIYARPDDLIAIRPSLFPEKFLLAGKSLRGDKMMARLDQTSGEVIPYFSRTQIDREGALAHRGLELCYLADYMDAFLFHVQGGGFVALPDGKFLRLNYAGKNGHPYRSIGGVLVDEGIIPKEELNLPRVLEYLRSEPGEMERVCFMNESYVFYKADPEPYPQLKPEHYPHGVLDFPVTPKRSIATDKRHFPGGALCYVEGGTALVGEPAQRLGAFAVDQDTGGAIVDAHLDFFAGAGDDAENLAGIMNDPVGRLYFLVLRP